MNFIKDNEFLILAISMFALSLILLIEFDFNFGTIFNLIIQTINVSFASYMTWKQYHD